LPTGRDSLPAQKRGDKCVASRGGSLRLLQQILPGPQKGRELSANIRSTCVEQSAHAVEVQNADSPPASAVYKAKRLVYHDRLKRRIFPRSDPPQTSRHLRFAFGGIAYQFNALPFGLALAPRVFTKCSFRGCSRAGRPSSGGAPVSTGLCNKQGKKRSLPQASYA